MTHAQSSMTWPRSRQDATVFLISSELTVVVPPNTHSSASFSMFLGELMPERLMVRSMV